MGGGNPFACLFYEKVGSRLSRNGQQNVVKCLSKTVIYLFICTY